MASKRYITSIAGVSVQIEAEDEGNCRYMVRMSIPGCMAPVRIGYLTGRGRSWLAEFFGTRPSQATASCKDACHALAQVAATQMAIAPYFTKAAA